MLVRKRSCPLLRTNSRNRRHQRIVSCIGCGLPICCCSMLRVLSLSRGYRSGLKFFILADSAFPCPSLVSLHRQNELVVGTNLLIPWLLWVRQLFVGRHVQRTL